MDANGTHKLAKLTSLQQRKNKPHYDWRLGHDPDFRVYVYILTEYSIHNTLYWDWTWQTKMKVNIVFPDQRPWTQNNVRRQSTEYRVVAQSTRTEYRVHRKFPWCTLYITTVPCPPRTLWTGRCYAGVRKIRYGARISHPHPQFNSLVAFWGIAVILHCSFCFKEPVQPASLLNIHYPASPTLFSYRP